MPEAAPTPSTRRARGPDAHMAVMAARRKIFLELFDFSSGRGLEIGPLDSAIAVRPAHDVRYVDVFDQTGVRDHYAHDQNVLVELVPDIDFPLVHADAVRTVSQAAGAGAPYDWFIASHVIEHVPDVIGWLGELGSLASPGAALLLAVPDRRYCFDRHRPPTTVGQALEAHEEGRTRPSTRAIYDFFTSVVSVDPAALWRGARPPGRAARIHDLATARSQVERGRAGQYVDCHVWTFTPQSLREQVDEWRALGLCDWYVDRLVERPGTVEFLAILRQLPAAEPRPSSSADGAPEPAELPDFLADEWAARDAVADLRREIRRLRKRNEKLRRRLAEVDVPVSVRIRRGLGRRVRRLRRRG